MLDFLGIGAQKCGTTWLYERLLRHPRLGFPAGKEVHFWNARYQQGIDWYRRLFPDEPGRKQGEITPAYAILPPQRIAEIRRFQPRLRIVYLIRNPIERAWSSALMALGRAEMTLDEASDQWFIDHFHSAGSMMRGDYERCLRNWYGIFEPERILVLRYDDIAADPLNLLSRCCHHIGVDPDFFAALPAEELRQRVFSGPGHAIRPTLLPVLREIYYSRIRRLADFLHQDLQEWLI